MEPTSDETLLTAYLDGELTSQEQELLEQRLADESELREHLTLLEETWQYLTLLDQESVDAEQVDVEQIEKTLRITAVSLSVVPLVPTRISQFSKWMIAALVGIMLFIGFFSFGQQSEFDDPSFRRMVERLDMYQVISDDGLDFLQLLAVHRVFLPPLLEGVPPIHPTEYEPRLLFQWLPDGFMSRAVNYLYESDESASSPLFYKNISLYLLLSKDSKERMAQIRKLHRDIEEAPRSVELVQTLHYYYGWRNSLQTYERNDLRKSETPEEKVAKIIDLKNRLDRVRADADQLVLPEIVGIEESESLADTLTKLPPQQLERLLNNEPLQILSELKQSSF